MLSANKIELVFLQPEEELIAEGGLDDEIGEDMAVEEKQTT